MSDAKNYVVPADAPVLELNATDAFNKLTPKERLYAHFLSKAAWYGGLITFVQTSPISPLIISLMQRLFVAESVEDLKKSALKEVTEEDFNDFLIYWCAVIANGGNYKGFGDTKIIPNISSSKFYSIVKSSAAFRKDEAHIQKLWDKLNVKLFSIEDNEKNLGLGQKGISTYFSSNCDYPDADLISEWLKSKNIEGWNSRAFKEVDAKSGKVLYDIRLPSINEESGNPTLKPEDYKNCVFQVTRGDYSPVLKYVNKNLAEAQKYCANDYENEMLKYYIDHFETGNIDDHKNGSRAWIKNKGPVVETYIGFIETYRDPVGVRGEFEGFVAMVNKETSKKYQELVDNAEDLLTKLPWGKDLEKDKFLAPDYTSLEVLTFSGSGIPLGINIPNYDDIRQTEGFKNVTLGNVLTSSFAIKSTDLAPFISVKDNECLENWRGKSFNVQVGLHELLGHGSGKLFMKDADGSFNFDAKSVLNPVTGKPIESWYQPGETFGSVFKTIGSSLEECRADAIGLYLCLEPTVLKIFGYEGADAEEIIYSNWLGMVYAGFGRATELYNPKEKVWGQAHSRARFVIAKVLLENGNGILKIEETDDGKDFLITFDRSKIHTDGKQAIHDFLIKLQTYKATADYAEMEKMYNHYSEVKDDGAYKFLSWRDIILAKKKPRPMFVQPNTELNNDKTDVALTTYECSASGLIKSFVDRFPDTQIMDIMEQLYEKDIRHFPKQ